MRMPFKKQVQPSRMERLRCGVQSRAADAAHSAQSMADRARPMAADAKSAAQAAAVSVSGAATSAAHSVADTAGTAAQSVAERAKPLASEAALRGAAAWAVLRYGVPAPGPIKRAVALVPVAKAGKAGMKPIAKAGKAGMKSKTGSAVMLMTAGGAAAAGVMWWRKSRAGSDSVWILDETDDLEPPDGWHEGAPVSSAREADRRSAADRVADRAAGLTDSEARKRSDTWP